MAPRLRRVLRALPGVRTPQPAGHVAGLRGLDQTASQQAFPDAIEPVSHRPWVSGAVGFVLGGLAVWSFGHFAQGQKAAPPVAVEATARPAIAPPVAVKHAAYVKRPPQPKLADAPIPGPRYVHRGGSILRDEAKASGHSLKKESKGARVTLEAIAGDWARVTDGNIHGWMKASVLGVNPPE